jgi:hypothetical protein
MAVVAVCGGVGGGGVYDDQSLLLRGVGAFKLRPVWFGDPIEVKGAVAAAIAAAIATVEVIFFREDHQAIFVEVKI